MGDETLLTVAQTSIIDSLETLQEKHSVSKIHVSINIIQSLLFGNVWKHTFFGK